MKPLAARIAALRGEGALSVFARARELERQGRSIIHLELGEPDFHPAAPVSEALYAAIAQGRDRYCAVQGRPRCATSSRSTSRAPAASTCRATTS